MEFRVMTFNLRVDTPDDGENAWKYRAQRAADVIRDADPSIIGTQEAMIHMIEDLQSRLDGYEWVGEGRLGGTEGEFTALFVKKSDFIIMDSGTFWLSETPHVPGSRSWDSAYPRICTWCSLRSVKDKDFSLFVYNVHLDNISDEARVQGLRLVRSVIAGHRQSNRLPYILLGDFNCKPGSRAIQSLADGNTEGSDGLFFRNSYTEAGMKYEEVGLTCHKYKGGHRGEPIDYIFTSPELRVIGVEIDRRTIRGGYPSDHYPVIAEIDFLNYCDL